MFRFRIPSFLHAPAEGTGGGAGTTGTTGNASTSGVKEGTPTANTHTTGTETTDHQAGGGGGTTKPDDAAGKGGDGKPAETAGQKPGDAPARVVPEKYDLQLPDTAKGVIAASDLTRFEAIARKYGMTQEEAQALVLEQATLVQEQVDEYVALAKADKEIGGDKLPVVEALARRVIDRVRPASHPRRQAFVEFIARGGDDKHPEMLAFFADLGRMMGEDKVVPGRPMASGETGGEKDVAKVLYPNQN